MRNLPMNKITKGQAKMYYKKIKREERMKMLVNILLFIPFIALIFWVAGCTTPQPDAQAKWDAIYEDMEPYVHETRHYGYVPADDEVLSLRSELNEHGISVFRVDPNNPEHQRRYKRHLSGNLNPTYAMEEDI